MAYRANNNMSIINKTRVRNKLSNSLTPETRYLTDAEVAEAFEKNLFIVPERQSSPYKPKFNNT